MSDRIERFIAEVEALQGSAAVVRGAAELGQQMAELLRAAGARRVIQARHPLLAGTGLADALRNLGGELITWGDLGPAETRAYLAACDAGIGVGVAAIARTGTVALPAGPHQGRSLTLLPPRVLLVVPPGALVDDLEDAFRMARADGRPPSVLNLVTGPSRSADIENDLSIGVHGPGQVHVFLVLP